MSYLLDRRLTDRLTGVQKVASAGRQFERYTGEELLAFLVELELIALVDEDETVAPAKPVAEPVAPIVAPAVEVTLSPSAAKEFKASVVPEPEPEPEPVVEPPKPKPRRGRPPTKKTP